MATKPTKATKKSEPKKDAKVVKSVSMRDHAAKKRDKDAQPRKLKQASTSAGKPVRALGRVIKAIFRPFRFLLAPFKTRPARFVGRILSKVLFLSYFKGSWQELKKVTWPDAKTTTKLTFAVIIFASVFGIFIALVDYVLDKIFRSILT